MITAIKLEKIRRKHFNKVLEIRAEDNNSDEHSRTLIEWKLANWERRLIRRKRIRDSSENSLDVFYHQKILVETL